MKKLFEARAVVLECQAKQRLVEKEIELKHLQQKPQREWQGLTDEEIDTWNIVGYESLREFVRAIEAKLKAKNGFPQTEKNT